MTDRLDLVTILADPTAVSPEDIPEVIGELERLKAIFLARLVAAPQPAREPAERGGGGDRLTIAQVAAWDQCSVKTVRRRIRDGTWRRGEHWFGTGRAVRFSRKALETWATATDTAPPTRGLAYDDGIPEGRRHRLRSLRNKGTRGHGATTGAETDGAAG